MFLFFALLALFYFRYCRQMFKTSNCGSVIPSSYAKGMERSSSQAGHERNLQYPTFAEGKPTWESFMQGVGDEVSRFDGIRTSSSVDDHLSHGCGFDGSPSPQEERLYRMRQRNHSPPSADPETPDTTHESDLKSLPSLPPQTSDELQAIYGVDIFPLTPWSESPYPTAPPSSPVPIPSILKRTTPPATTASPSGLFGWLQIVQNNFYPVPIQDSIPTFLEAKVEGRKKGVRFGEDQYVEIERVPEELRTRPKREVILLGMGEV